MQWRTLHVNDFHSNNSQLAAIKPVSDALLADAKRKAMPAQFVTVGDLEGCNVQYISTKSGMPENSAFMNMGVRKFVPGNHTYDLGSGFNVPGYARTMDTLLTQHPEASLIATNLDLSQFPQYQRIASRFHIDNVQGPHGTEKVATLGLVTKEGTSLGDVPGIGYMDATNSAVQTMLEVAQTQGVKKFVILSHLGLNEDQALAKALVNNAQLRSNDLKVAAIFGGHTHDLTAAPVWVGKTGYEIPIVQAGSNGRWLGQLDLAIRPDGSADRFRTIARMHQITPTAPRDAGMDAFVHAQTSELSNLRNTDYSTRIMRPLSSDGLRKGESELGNLVSDAVDNHVQADAVLTHSGWMRTGLEPNIDAASGKAFRPVTRETVADMFKSGGDAELEKAELFVYKMRGNEVRNVLESSMSKQPAPQSLSLGQRIRNAFSDKPLNADHEGHGYFLQTAGIKYDFDLSKPVGNRIGKIFIRGANADYIPLDPSRMYDIASRQFIFDKWSRMGAFGERAVERTAVGQSPVDMVGNFIQGKTIGERPFVPQGRIIDNTPKASELPLKVGQSIIAPSITQAEARDKKSH